MAQYYAIRHSDDGELYHYGVKGMRWGHRKASQPQLSTSRIREKYDSAKSDYKNAKKEYNRAFNKSYNYTNRHPIGQFVSKKISAESDKRWEDAVNKADNLRTKKSEYKQIKSERKKAIKSTYKDMQKKASFGEKFMYNDATRKKAAKYVVDNDMSMAEASKRAKSDAKKNTAIILAAYGAVTVSSLYAMRK
jgi:hypothetical protein